jgi:4-diphosphocytidyl-2-C-methyl-D-erythritol kinase
MDWLAAPAKLNLFLHVVGRRADGYHLLQTVFRLLDWHDEVGIERTAGPAIERLDAPAGVDPESDLCLRAAQRLQAFATNELERPAAQLGARIALRKRLPIGGGLGGGSSDAASVLLGLNRAWGLGLKREVLCRIGLELGADVPFFVFGRSALGEGIGEQLTAIDLPPAWYLVLVPPVGVATAAVFADPALTRNTKALKIPPFFQDLGRNDLEPVVCARSREVAAHLEWLKRRSSNARMTGSGACVFAEFANRDDADVLLKELPDTMRGVVVRGLDRHPQYGWLGTE